MANFKSFIARPDEVGEKPEDESQRKQTIYYFDELKEVIRRAQIKHLPGEHVCTIRDITWDRVRGYSKGKRVYQQKVLPLVPNLTQIYNKGSRPVNLAWTTAGIPDIYILKELMEAEGLRVEIPDWMKSNGVVAEVYVADDADK